MTVKERESGLDRFIEREIYACQSALVEEAFKKQLFLFDDIENLYRPFDGKLIAPTVCIQCKREFSCLDSENGQCETCFEENQEPQEIFEWWLISPWFGKKLLIEGEPILENEFGLWWGRCTTGQAIMLDYVIQKIYDDIMS